MFEVGLDQALYEVDDLDAAACLDRAAECDLQDRVPRTAAGCGWPCAGVS